MKKFFLLFFVVMTAMSVSSQYNKLTFRTTNGEEHFVGLTNLNITFTKGEMIAKSDEHAVTLPLNSLESMEFTVGIAAISEVLTDKEFKGKLSVYTTDGKLLGIYESADAALAKLPQGLYIFTAGNGVTTKIKIDR